LAVWVESQRVSVLEGCGTCDWGWCRLCAVMVVLCALCVWKPVG